MQATVQVTPDRIMQIAHGFWPASIVSSAAAYDFFTHIARGNETADASVVFVSVVVLITVRALWALFPQLCPGHCSSTPC